MTSSKFRTELEALTEPFENMGLGGRHIWVARDANQCLYVYTKKPEWNERTRRWRGAFYGSFCHNAFPWLKAGCCIGFELNTLEQNPIV